MFDAKGTIPEKACLLGRVSPVPLTGWRMEICNVPGHWWANEVLLLAHRLVLVRASNRHLQARYWIQLRESGNGSCLRHLDRGSVGYWAIHEEPELIN